jgi:hypothetical protein
MKNMKKRLPPPPRPIPVPKVPTRIPKPEIVRFIRAT